MNDFEAAKCLDVREVVRYYGVSLDRHGKGLCCFHSEKSPSLKVYEDHFYCYGCSCSGDAIDFVTRLHNLSPLDALKQLNRDFALGLDFDALIDTEAIEKRRTEQRLVQNFDTWEKWAFRVVCRHYHELKDTIKSLAPESPDDEPAPEWVRALVGISRIEYWLEILTFGSIEDKLNYFTFHRSEVKTLFEKQKEVRKNP